MGAPATYRSCPTCGRIYPAAQAWSCARDGATLYDDPRVVAGKFVLLRRLGQGGMGEVWEADQPSLARKVALKLMHPRLAADPNFLRRFEREARAAGQLSHPNIVTLYETGQADGHCYLAMEFLVGQTLGQLQQREPRQPLQRALALFLPVARAMELAHQHGVVHRDLKPDNIFLRQPAGAAGSGFQVKVLDFGIAKLQGGPRDAGSTAVGVSIGSPQYMAPEQFGGAAEADDRADVFALGVMLYELLTGQRPYAGTAMMLISGPAPLLRQLAPAAPVALEALVARMLAIMPQDRPSIQEVAQVVAALQGPERSAGQLRPRWLALGGVVGVVLGLALYLGLRASGGGFPADAAAQRERALSALKEGLSAAEANLRAASAAAIGQGRDARLRALLAPHLEDPDAEVRAEAASGLGQLGAQQEVPGLVRLAQQDPSPLAQVAAGGALVRLHRPEGRAALQQVLTGTQDAARLEAALRLAEIGDEVAIARLQEWRKRLGLPAETRLRILARLAQGGDADAAQELGQLAAAEPGPMFLSAASDLARGGDESARGRLVRAAGQPGPQQLLAARLLAALGDGRGYELFRDVVQDPSQAQAARVLAAEGMAACGRREGIAVLGAALSDKGSRPLRVAAAGALLRLAEEDPSGAAAQSLSWARAALGDRQWTVRGDAVSVLGDVEAEESVALLGQALRDESIEVRRAAAKALGRKQVRAALQQLQPGLDDVDPVVRRSVMQAIGQVASVLQRRGDAEAGRSVRARLALVARTGSPIDAVVARGTLLSLGDESQRGALQQGLRSADPRVRRLALELGGGEVQALLLALQDADLEVRASAARLLAARGMRQGAAVLRELLAKGGVEGLIAYGLLRRLGEAAAAPEGLREILSAGDLPTRVAAAEAMGDLPVEEAVPLLRRAVFDVAAVVRRQVAEAAFALAGRGRAEGWELLGVLRDDDDLGVRVRAGLLLNKLGSRPAAAVVVAAPAAVVAVPAPDLGAPAPVVKREVVGAPPPPPPEQLLKESALAVKARDFRKALSLLDQAEGLASGPRRSGLRTQIWLERGRLYEARSRWDQALEEYGRLLRMAPAQRSRVESAAVAQLASRFGRLVVSRVERGRCQTTEKWARPGECVVDVGGKPQTVRIRAGEVKKVGTCQ